jgi:hypothetical protein
MTTLISVLVMTGNVFAGDPAAPTQYNAYDGFTPGARAIAMGTAFVAVADDATAVYYNPAGLAEIQNGCFALTYEATRQSTLASDQIFAGESLRDTSLQYLSLVSTKGAITWRPLANSTWLTTNAQGWVQDQVKINAYTLSASHKGSVLTTGLNLSYLTGEIAQSSIMSGIPATSISSGYGFSMDFGFLALIAPQIRFGMNLRNLAGFMWWENFEKDQLPFILNTGVDFQIKDSMNFTAEVEKRYYRKTDEQSLTKFGWEQWLGKVLVLRAGIYGTDLSNASMSSITGGIGYVQSAFDLSLAAEKYNIYQTDVYRYVVSINIPM